MIEAGSLVPRGGSRWVGCPLAAKTSTALSSPVAMDTSFLYAACASASVKWTGLHLVVESQGLDRRALPGAARGVPGFGQEGLAQNCTWKRLSGGGGGALSFWGSEDLGLLC